MSETTDDRGLSLMGATFAERQAAREAAEKTSKKAEPKAVSAEQDSVEDKAVKSAESKRPARKKS